MRNAFTLIEFLVVIAIITILGALLYPAIKKAMDKSRQMREGTSLTLPLEKGADTLIGDSNLVAQQEHKLTKLFELGPNIIYSFRPASHHQIVISINTNSYDTPVTMMKVY